MVAFNRTPSSVSRESALGRIRENVIYVGIVKDNNDDQRMGRLWVWVPELGGDPNDKRSWITCAYASPFAGSTSPQALVKDGVTQADSQSSYGFWATPADKENQVLVCFANGDPARAYWFACVFQQGMNHMVPGVAANRTTQSAPNDLAPSTEYNKRGTDKPDKPDRPIFEPLHDGLVSQGLYPDGERGPSSTSARREAPSRVVGISTPRGHTLSLDDDPDNEVIRLRTRGGAQIVISETTGFIYLISKAGNSWLEVSDAGVDVYTSKAFSVRAEGDINLRADQNINLDAGQGVHVKAGQTITTDSGADTLARAGANHRVEAAAEASQKSGGASIRQGLTIQDNTRTPAAVSVPAAAPKVDTKGGGRTNTDSIVSRMPAHEPWPLHPKRGRADAGSDMPKTPPALTGSDYERIGARPSFGGPAASSIPGAIPDAHGPDVGGPPSPTAPGPSIKTGTGETRPVPAVYATGSGTVKVGNQTVPASVLAAIQEGAAITGNDPGYMMAMAAQESGFNPTIKSKSSSATGLFQFTDQTWDGMVKKYGKTYNIGPEDRYDPRAQAIMAGLYANENKAYIGRKTGLEVGNTEIYMGHFLGTGGATTFLKQYQRNPDGPAIDSASKGAVSANPNIFYDKASGRARTNSEVYNLLKSKVETPSHAYNKALASLTPAGNAGT